MDRKRKIHIAIGCIIALVALVVAVFIAIQNTDTTNASYPQLSDASSLYDYALTTLDAQQNMSATVSYVKETTIGGEVFRESAQQQVVYQNIGDSDFCGNVTETLTVGTHTVQITELYANGQCYFTVADIPFQCQLTQEDYLARYTPIAPISPTLYASVTGTERNGEKVITFKEPAEPESWAIPANCTLQYAEGKVYLGAENQLTKSIYTIAYNTDTAFVKFSVSVELQQGTSQTIHVPTDVQNYTPLEYMDGPRMLEIASGHLMDCGNISASYAEQIHCQLFGDLRTTQISLQTNHTNGWYAQVDTTVTMENTGKTGTLSTKQQTEIFQNGTYSLRVDHVDSEANQEVSQDAMRSYCRDILVSTVILPEHIAQASVTDTSSTLQIQFDINDDFAQMLKSEALTALYQDPAILQDKEYQTQDILCYLHIDKATLLPVSSGFQLSGNYHVDNLQYPLTYSTEQSYQLYTQES